MATLLRSRLPDDDLASLRRVLARPDLTRSAAAWPLLLFGLAQALDARGEFAEAADCLREANALALRGWSRRGEAYDPARHEEFAAGIMAACDPSFFERVRGFGIETELPVFVFGLPRSGTTLIEQVLASHSQVFGAGELRLASEHFEALPAAMGSAEPPLACLSRLDRGTIAATGRRYFDAACGRLTPRRCATRRGQDAGQLPAPRPARGAVPEGPVHPLPPRPARRGRLLLDDQLPQDPLGERPRAHRLAAFSPSTLPRGWWTTGRASSLPVPMLDVAYEDTVADLEDVARRLVAWCGLDWEPACLEFHKSERPVRTASVRAQGAGSPCTPAL